MHPGDSIQGSDVTTNGYDGKRVSRVSKNPTPRVAATAYKGNRYGTRVPTDRENKVIKLVAEGYKNKEVAVLVGTTEHVVKNYLRVIFDKLGLWNRVELALWYVSHNSQ